MTRYLYALGLTIGIEVAIALLIIPREMWKRRLGDVVLANLVTHPLATVAVWRLGIPWLVAEVAVTAGEAVIYRFVSGFAWSRAVLLSFACNAVTASLSFVV